MNIFLLDAGGAALLILLPIAAIFLLLVWGLVEGSVIYLFQINRFWKSVWHAIIVNLVSVAVGFLLIGLGNTEGYEKYFELDTSGDIAVLPWFIYWTVSVVIEALILKALNKAIPWGKIFAASVVMNIVSYIIMYGYVYYNNL